ncbi:MAG TPA: tRNA pseudouridine(13) synthase TruD [Sulfurivirga caldicuralii]|nr:tRNA pseudouridine(13) synthase TruD [Sulfurivirga caldicuralii]
METVQPWPPLGQALFKQQLEDFQVEEVLPFSLSGTGEHLWLWVEKRGQNTAWVAQQLACWVGISSRHVGSAGLKDRHGVTRQWFSLWLPGQVEPDLSTLQLDGVRVLKACRHGRKLQTGALSGNRFVITLRQVDATPDAVSQRLSEIRQVGFPNYYGMQRFGRDAANIDRAWAWVEAGCPRIRPAVRARHLSVLRSLVFNAVLAERVIQDCWQRYVPGDVLQLAGSTRCFVDDGSEALAMRVVEGDVHPTGPLPGEGGLQPRSRAAVIERAVLKRFADLEPLWHKVRMRQMRRPLRVIPQVLHWYYVKEKRELQLSFFLPAGSYATALLRSLFQLKTLTLSSQI